MLPQCDQQVPVLHQLRGKQRPCWLRWTSRITGGVAEGLLSLQWHEQWRDSERTVGKCWKLGQVASKNKSSAGFKLWLNRYVHIRDICAVTKESLRSGSTRVEIWGEMSRKSTHVKYYVPLSRMAPNQFISIFTWKELVVFILTTIISDVWGPACQEFHSFTTHLEQETF